MSFLTRMAVTLSATAGMMPFAVAGSPVGVWHGHVTVDISKLPPIADPVRKKAMMDQIKLATQVKVTLTLKSDKTYLLVAAGGVRQQPPETGTYTYTATSVTIQSTSKTGHTSTQAFTLSKNGKSLSLTQGPASVTFVR